MKKNQSLLARQQALSLVQLLLVIGVVALSGVYLVTKIFAATASMSVLPATAAVNIGDNITLAIRENSSTDPVNAVQANVTFDTTRLQYVSTMSTGSPFSLEAETTPGVGTLRLVRTTAGGASPVSGDNLVANVTFKALVSGPATVALATGSLVLRSTDNVDILVARNNATLTLADTVAPTVPAGLAPGATTMTSVAMSWAASSDNVGVTGYRVYRDGVQVATQTAISYTNTGLAPGTSYSYKVAAVDSAGNVSPQSTTLVRSTLADTQAPTVPGKPTSATQTMTSITLSWAVSTDNLAVQSYRLYRNGTQVGAPTSTSYTDANLAVNTTYSYTVAAYDAAGNGSAQSASTSVKTLADTQAPSVPVGVNGTVNNQALTVALTWSASTDNVGVTSYAIARDGAVIGTATTTAFTATNVPTGVHIYTVAAKDAAGNTSAASTGLSLQVYVSSDINRDGKVNVFDLSTLLTNWSASGTNTSDVNGDNVVNVFDLSILLSKWTG
jgi:chitodextrinase